MVTRLRWPTFLAALLLSATACAGARPKLATQGPPPPKEGEDDFGRQRQAWIESMHRAAPGVDWRAIERENRQRSAARLMEIAATGPSSAPAKGVFWTQRGPTTQTGRTWATAIAGDGNMLLVGSGDEGGGLFSGTPGANSWTQRANLIGTGVKQLVAVPGPPETWVAVASGDSEVWVSSDRGVSWQTPNGLPNSPCGFLITRILREAGASRTVYLLATAPSCTPSATYTLLRSDDGGLDFVSMVSDNYTAAPDMWIDRVKAGPLYLLTDTGFKFSSDHGATFTTIGGLASSNPPPTNLRLAGSEAGAPTFYALVSNGTLGPPTNLWVSTDGGATWKNGGTLQDFFLSQGAVTASISNPNVVLLGGVNTARSTNGGLSFKVVNDWSEYYGDPAHKLHADLRGLDCAMYQGTETIFANTDGGTFMSTDLGATFTNMTQVGMINAEYYSTLTSKNDPNLIAAGTQDQGIQQSTPVQGGTMAFDQIIAGDYGHLTSTNGDHNMLYAAYPGFVAVLDHESPPQTVTAAQFPAARNRSWMPNLLADPADATAVYLTGDPLFRLYSSGFTWQSTAFAQNFSGGQGDYLTALAISKVDSSYWYAASALGRLWYSRDQGATWTESASQGPYAHYFYGTALLASTTSAATCYVGGSGYSGPA
ncbi:MAG TPA: hypothetical protein VMW75_18475, partial [Thermoanaerobaculia bacterium]|nr:hypothetical protein [Thermoanaerobaculia bacterium]